MALELVDLRTEIRLRSATVHAVEGVSLSVAEGETLGLVGESGCGKTLTGLSIMRLLPPGGHVVGGQILVGGRDLAALPEDEMRKVRGNDVAMVFQDPMTSLNPTLTVGRQIAESVRVHRGVSWKDANDRAEEVLGLVGMPRPKERLEDYPHQLSGGMRQRVGIAMALACDPKVLIADEPTTALDVTIQDQILHLLDDLKSRLQMAVLLVIHDLGVIAGRADRVAVMYAGKIVEMTETPRLFLNTRHPYTEALLASIPDSAAEHSGTLYSIPGLPPDLAADLTGCRFAPRCRYATDECRGQEPVLGGDDPSHPYACYHPVGEPDEQWSAPTEVQSTDVVGWLAENATGPEPEPDHLLVLDHLVKEFPVTSGMVMQRKVGVVHAVSDVSLTVARGETFGLVGESGCGKSTLGRLIAALDRPTDGQILINGEDFASMKGRTLRRRRRDVQLVFQDPYASLDPRMRVSQILREPLAIQKVGSRHEQQQRTLELMDEVGLPRRALERYPHEFSGGQRQRIGLARALALEPKLVVADEPVSALDVSIQAQILNLMKDLQARHQLTYVFISHDLGVVRYLADRIGVMYLGSLVEVGPAEQVYLAPAHPYTRALIDTVPVADPVREATKTRAGIRGELPSAINPPSGCRFRTRCPLAREICEQQAPPLVATDPVRGAHHQVACHFPLVPGQALPLLADDAAVIASSSS